MGRRFAPLAKGKGKAMSADPPVLNGLEVGDPVPDSGWRGPDGKRIALSQSAHAGRLSVVFACAAPDSAHGARELAGFRELYGRFRALGVQVFAVTAQTVSDNLAAIARLGLPFPLLSDPDCALGRALGLQGAPSGNGAGAWPACTLLIGPNQRVLKKILFAAEGQQAATALTHCQTGAAAQTPVVVSAQAPVLMVPEVLDPG